MTQSNAAFHRAARPIRKMRDEQASNNSPRRTEPEQVQYVGKSWSRESPARRQFDLA